METILRLRDKERLTIVSVTHHPDTTIDADEIIVLDKGVVEERGTYEELTTGGGCGLFSQMVTAKKRHSAVI